MAPKTTLPAWFMRAIEALQAGDINGWMEIYTQDAVHEFPFAPPETIQRLEGRDKIKAYIGQLPELIHFGPLSEVRVREVDNELIIEATGHHRRVKDETPKDLSYVWFITLADGKVTHIRDYMNPFQLSAL